MKYSAGNAVIVLTEVARRDDVDGALLTKTHEAIVSAVE